MTDTHPAAAEMQLAVLRGLGAEARLGLAFRMSATARALLASRLRQEHPDWNADDVRRELVRCALATGSAVR